ncbi:BadF/BadG/BcrA/BcrD ATPase family protein [Jiangella rhizosphaerae]|uniref:BadF/BadG/BcrA/BcrD ATPase family protein n=1 Tax=Jiangella rhizosphaerae TaxID=2293569 RepID=UPI001314ABCE|nr:BadF/BadG/BcrA/BcrD ATPase family protein [Jiangella rhizosphaerae]
MTLVLGVDGGNSKTDAAVVTSDGELLAWVRGPGSATSPDRAAATVAELLERTGLDVGAAVGGCYLAGVDLPFQADAVRTALADRGVVAEVANDAWALLRAGAPPSAPSVAVVCGAGLKCVARAGEARVEFPGLGWQTGDLSGAGDHLAREAIRAAARAEDGRGPATALRDVVRSLLGVPSIGVLAERMLRRELTGRDLDGLAPAVLDAWRAGDDVAGALVRGLAEEIAASARAARRAAADAVGSAAAWTLVLGGGLFADPAGRLLSALPQRLWDEFEPSVVTGPPVAGAVLLGLDRLGVAGRDAAILRTFHDATPEVVR